MNVQKTTDRRTNSQRLLTMVAASALASALSGVAFAEDKAPAASGTDNAPVKGCWHNCAGHASCKGQGNESCKGKNGCGGQGKNNKECAKAKTEDACKKIKICDWHA